MQGDILKPRLTPEFRVLLSGSVPWDVCMGWRRHLPWTSGPEMLSQGVSCLEAA